MSQPKKSLGQHWLRDKSTLQKIAHMANVNANDTVLEIGPGLGTLTTVLASTGAKIIAIEKDDELAAKLNIKNTEIINQDILTYDRSNLPSNYKVVANIPYYLTSNLIRILLYQPPVPSALSLLIQKEVAERITAGPGAMSLLAFAVQYRASVELGDIVPAALFDPPPKVDSQIIGIFPRSEPVFAADEKKLFRIVKSGFSNRRKTLANSLSGGLSLPKSKVIEILQQSDLGLNQRAQELSLTDWQRLYNNLDTEL